MRLVDKPVVNRHFDRLTDIQDHIERRCRDLAANPETLGDTTLFTRWP